MKLGETTEPSKTTEVMKLKNLIRLQLLLELISLMIHKLPQITKAPIPACRLKILIAI